MKPLFLRRFLFTVFTCGFFLSCSGSEEECKPKTNLGTVRLNENGSLTKLDTIKLDKNEKILNVSKSDPSQGYLALIEDTLTKNRYIIRFYKENRYEEILVK